MLTRGINGTGLIKIVIQFFQQDFVHQMVFNTDLMTPLVHAVS